MSSRICKYGINCKYWEINGDKIKCFCKFRHFSWHFKEWKKHIKILPSSDITSQIVEKVPQDLHSNVSSVTKDIKYYQSLRDSITLPYHIIDSGLFIDGIAMIISDYCLTLNKDHLFNKSVASIIPSCINCPRSDFNVPSCTWIMRYSCSHCKDELQIDEGVYPIYENFSRSNVLPWVSINAQGALQHDDFSQEFCEPVIRSIVLCSGCYEKYKLGLMMIKSTWQLFDFESNINDFCTLRFSPDSNPVDYPADINYFDHEDTWFEFCIEKFKELSSDNKDVALKHIDGPCLVCGKMMNRCGLCKQELGDYSSIINGQLVDCSCIKFYITGDNNGERCRCEKSWQYDFCDCDITIE